MAAAEIPEAVRLAQVLPITEAPLVLMAEVALTVLLAPVARALTVQEAQAMRTPALVMSPEARMRPCQPCQGISRSVRRQNS